MSSPFSLQPDQMVGPYKIVKKVGTGGMGEVYEGWDDNLKRPVAIKILTPGPLSDEEIKNRFLAEGRSLARLRHPNVVNLYMIGEHQGLPFMAMEFIKGATLDEYIVNNHCGLKELLSLFSQMLDGLAAAHAEKIIHRDIKPQNIMVDLKNVAHIVDFGIAKAHTDLESPKTQQGIVLGTKNYMAPELLQGKPAGPQTDIYALGLVFQFMLTGEAPKADPTPGGSKKLIDLLPRQLKDILVGMTQKSPELRYKAIPEIIADLKNVSLDEMHADLMVESAKDVKIENLEQVYAHCRKHGLDIAESRLVVNLATRMDHKISAPTDDNADRTEAIGVKRPVNLDPEALNKAMERVRSAKTAVISKRVSTGPAPMPPPRERRPVNLHLGKIFVLLSICSSAYFYMAVDRKKAIAWFEARVAKAAMGAKFQSPKSKQLVIDPQEAPSLAPTSSAAQAVPATSAPPPVLAKAPALKPGQTFKFRYQIHDRMKNETKDQTLEWEVLSIKDGKVNWEDANGSSEVTSINPFLPPYEASGTVVRKSEKNEIDGNPADFFPLTEAKNFVTRVNPVSRPGVASYDSTCVVGPQQTTATPAGSFKTLRIDCTSQFNNGTSESYYYSPQLNHWVAMEMTNNDEKAPLQVKVQLTGYTLPAPPKPDMRAPAAIKAAQAVPPAANKR
jgi:hypothetical protein